MKAKNKIDISKEMYVRLTYIKPVIDSVIGEETDLETCVDLVLSRGLHAVLDDLLGSLDAVTLLNSFQELAIKYPENVCQYIVETIKQGANELQRENTKKKLGFVPLVDTIE
jgi:hypothetical protein